VAVINTERIEVPDAPGIGISFMRLGFRNESSIDLFQGNAKASAAWSVIASMTDQTLYRYTAAGEGVFMQEDDLTPPELRAAVEAGKAWLPQPHLDCDCQFYMTAKGKEMYETVLKPIHEVYMPPIEVEAVPRSSLKEICYEDEYQVGEKVQGLHLESLQS
jgi:hypothetical protein